MKIRIAALGVLLLAATACTPEEVVFWNAYHSEHPAEAEQLLDELGLLDVAVAANPAEGPARATRQTPPQVVDMQTASSFDYDAAVTCGPPTLRLTNTGGVTLYYFVYYGASQTPLVDAVRSETYTNYGPPPITAGETVTVDLSPAVGTTTWIALDRGWGTGGVVASADITDC